MNQTNPIRILVADDHPIVRKGLHTLISSEPDLEWVGEAADGVEAVEQALALRPDVILMDIMMPRLDGVEAIKQIKANYPQAGILIITSFAEDDKIFQAIKAGALGYLLKDSAPQELLQAIYDVYQDKPSLHPTIALKLMQEIQQPSTQSLTTEPLTEREVEILKLIAQGLSNQEIAARLVVSERTIGNHVGNILNTLHLANRTQAALYALKKGLASLDDAAMPE
jgi:NarL family two-component system response regulator LiaR